jgi:hypothetical protein
VTHKSVNVLEKTTTKAGPAGKKSSNKPACHRNHLVVAAVGEDSVGTVARAPFLRDGCSSVVPAVARCSVTPTAATPTS